MHALLHALHRLPDLAILTIVVGTTVGLVAAAPFVVRVLSRRTIAPAHDEAAYDAFKAVTAMMGVVLAFSLVQANANLRSAETLVGREAIALAAIDRILLRMDTPNASDLRPLVAAYGQSRIRDEWPEMSVGERSSGTDARYTDLSRAARALRPADARQQSMFSELLKHLDELAEVREMLILDSEVMLPDFFWITTGGLLLLALGLAALSDVTLSRIVGLGSATAAVSLLLAFVIIVDQPFAGETSVSPAPLRKVLELNARRI